MAIFKVRRFYTVDGRREFDGPVYTVQAEHLRFVTEAFPPADKTGGWLVTPVPVITLDQAVADWNREGASTIELAPAELVG